MLKKLFFVFAACIFAFIAGCGGSSSSTPAPVYSCDLTIPYELTTGGTVDGTHMIWIQVTDPANPQTVYATKSISSYTGATSTTFEAINALSVNVTMFHDEDGFTAVTTAPDDTNYDSAFDAYLPMLGQLSEDDPYISYNNKATLPVNSTTGGQTADAVSLTDGEVTTLPATMTVDGTVVCPEVCDILVYMMNHMK